MPSTDNEYIGKHSTLVEIMEVKWRRQTINYIRKQQKKIMYVIGHEKG